MSFVSRLAALFREPTASSEMNASAQTERSSSEKEDPSESVETIAVVCDRPSSGVRRYDLTLSVDTSTDATITAIDPELLTAHFEVAEGGVDSTDVRVRAVDFTGEASAEDTGILLYARLDQPVPLESVELRIHAAVDHGGATVTNRIRLTAVR